MATFSIDNDRVTSGVQNVAYDQSGGVQTLATADTGNEIDVTLLAGELDGLDSGFETFLIGLGLSAAQKNYAVLTDAASSSSTFIQVTADPGETLNDLKFLADSTVALTGITTIAGGSLYVHVDVTGNYATLWTTSDNSGRIVGALALTGETIDNVTTHIASAGVQMLFFEAIKHTNTASADETLSLSDVLQVGVDTAVSFYFEQFDASKIKWAAVGTAGAAMLITGQDLNVKDSGKPSAIGTIEKGGTDPSDAVNTSKATDTTIGINAQHFAPTNTADGATGVFTFVTGYKPISAATPTFTGQNVKQIDYDDYINVSSASVFISQLTGGSSAKIHFSFFEAGGGGVDKAPADLLPEEGYADVPGASYSYIGNQDNDTHLTDDTDVAIASVVIGGFTWNFNDASNGTAQGGITVTITGNDVIVDGAKANDLITFTAFNGASAVDGTFNRIDIQALQGSASFDIGHIDLTSGGLTGFGLGSHLFVDDDGPSLTPQAGTGANDLKVDNDLSGGDPSAASSSYGLLPGTDGLASYTILGPEDNVGAFQWTYDDTSHMSITGTYLGTDLYTLVLNSSTGGYTFTMIDELPGSTLDLSPAEVIKAGSPDNPILEIGAAQNDDFVRMTADSSVSGASGNINESHGFVGVDNGNLDTGESLTFTLHEADGTLITFEGIQIGTKSAQGGTYSWVATIAGGGTISSSDPGHTAEVVGKNGTIDISATDLEGATIESITITKISGPATKIGVGDIHIIVPPDDVQLGFTVELKDGDGDAATQSFVVDIDANNDGVYDATVNAALAPLELLGVHSFNLQSPWLTFV
jgi:hypothetical protein